MDTKPETPNESEFNEDKLSKNQKEVSSTKNRTVPFLLVVTAIVVVLVAIALTTDRGGNLLSNSIDLNGLTGSVGDSIALVNDVPITREQVNENLMQISQGGAQAGFDLEDPEVRTYFEQEALNISINNELLRQAASLEKEKPTEEMIESEIQNLIAEFGGEEVFISVLEDNNLSMEELRESISEQLMVQSYIDANTEVSAVERSDIENFYAELLSNNEGDDFPALEEIELMIEQQLMTQKQQEAVGDLLERLRSEASIEIL